MSQTATVAHASLDRFRRTIVTSDLHGDLAGFRALLQKSGFSSKDALVIVGDLLEKGPQSFSLLRAVMELAQGGNVFVLAGNNDLLLSEWGRGEASDEDVWRYLRTRDTSVLMDMARALEHRWDTLEDVQALKAAVWAAFQPELRFLDALPHILDTKQFTFVHAGLGPGPLTEQDYEFCLTAKAFGRQTHRFEKPVIVGHWPCSNYYQPIVSVAPYWNRDTNVLSIDGGNQLNRWGRINYLVLDGAEPECHGLDLYPKVRALTPQAASEDPLTLEFPRTLVELRETGPVETRCYFPELDRELTISSKQIYSYKGQTYCWNLTTYRLPVQAGDVLSCCALEPQGMLAIRGDTVGYYEGPYEPLPAGCTV